MDLLVKNKRGSKHLDINEVLYFESYDDQTTCITLEGSYDINNKLYELCDELNLRKIIRISKSHIINILKIKKLKKHPNYRAKLTMTDNSVLYVNRTYLKEFIDRIKEGCVDND